MSRSIRKLEDFPLLFYHVRKVNCSSQYKMFVSFPYLQRSHTSTDKLSLIDYEETTSSKFD